MIQSSLKYTSEQETKARYVVKQLNVWNTADNNEGQNLLLVWLLVGLIGVKNIRCFNCKRILYMPALQ